MSGFSFGTPATTAPAPAFGAAAPTFGTSAGTTNFNFPAQPTNFSFGAPAVSTSAQTPTLGFGSPATAAAPAPTLGFGASATAATPAPTLAFGAPAAAAAPVPTLGFGAAAAAPTSSFSFGAPAVSAAAAAPTLAFGTSTPAATAAPTLGFGASATTAGPVPTLGFGTPAAATAPAPTLGGFGATAAAPASNVTFGAPATGTAPAPTLGFGAPAATSTAAPTFSFGTTTPAVTTASLPTFGLGGGAFFGAKPATTTSASLNFGTTTTSTSTFSLPAPNASVFAKPTGITTTTAAPAAAFVGLGGIDVSATQPKAGDSKQDIKIKETQVPDEIAKTVEALKAHIKSQKALSSDIGRTSTSKLSNVSTEMANLQWSLQEIANSVESNYNQIKLLRKETTNTIQIVEMAQRTQDTPAGLQFENSAPFQFFQNMVAKYEQDLISFRQQIALTEHHMRSLANPQCVSPEDLKRGFRQLNESFISLAGRLHEIHQKVEAQKEQYLNLRKYRLRDSTNIFAKLDAPPEEDNGSRLKNFIGPTPFSSINSFGKTFGNTANVSSSGVQTSNQLLKS